MKVTHTPSGRLHIVITNPATRARVVDRWVPNLVTSAGRRLLAELLTGTATGIEKIEFAAGGPTNEPPYDPATYPPPSPQDEALANEVVRVATEINEVVVQPDSSPPRMMVSVTASLPANPEGDPLPLREAGLVVTIANQQESVLYNRVVFDTITKQPELQLTMSWEIIF